MPRVIHFEISANNPEAQAQFYRSVLDWEITKFPGPQDYWFIKTGEAGTPGIDGALFRPNESFTATVNTIEVPNLDEVLAKLQAAGGTVVVEQHALPGFGYRAYCKDPEGTLFGLHQPDPTPGG